MITLYTFGPAFGLPDPSPFVTKAEVLLKMAGLPYRMDTKGFRKAPKGKLPYIRDGEDIIADSTFIRLHLEKRYNIDFDEGLSPKERGLAWAVEKMCEDHLYWLLVYELWADDANFKRGPAKFFDAAPAPVRPFVKWFIRRQVKQALHGQGAGRYSESERAILADRAFASLSAILGDQLTSWEKSPAEPTQPSSPSSWARFALSLTPASRPAPSRTQISRTTAPD